MSEVAERKRIAVKVAEPPRCSDYDTDCAGVMDHARCHAGGNFPGGFTVDPADGYCPYLGSDGGSDGG